MFIIADSSALVSLVLTDDSLHKKALAIRNTFEKQGGVVIISPEVFSETMNVLGKRVGHTLASTAARKIHNSPTFLIQTADPSIDSKAIDRFEQAPQSVSYTDCVVMALADEYKTKIIFGFDEIFEKNGYKLPL